MRRREICAVGLAVALACGSSNGASVVEVSHATTSGAIAIANLDHQIAQRQEEAGVEELLLVRSRFLGDYDALDRAVALAETRGDTGAALLRRARARSAVHRFADALVDVAAAERAGAEGDDVVGLRASILVATGFANEVVSALEDRVSRRPGFASRCALASAYSAVGRIEDADRLYVAALTDLDTTSPFPYAWVYFARGSMWVEHGEAAARGEALYRQALVHLPEFAAASIHLAELEVARGDLVSATTRLERLVAASDEPEALALVGELHVRTGDQARGWREISRARQRFDSLLARHPLAFADHAARFYLGPGADAERAWALARQNLAARGTRQAVALAVEAARAAGREHEVEALVAGAKARLGRVARPDPGSP
jgi:tetratricopeptide (TPR) repeat protein